MSDADDCSHQMTAGLAIKELCIYIDTFSSVYVCICAQLMKTLWDRELCSPSEKSQWVLASWDSTRGHWFPHTPSFLLSFNCNMLNDSHLQKPQHSTLVLFYTRKINISLYIYCVFGFLTAQKIGNKTNALKKNNIYYSCVIFVVHIRGISLGCRCPHYHFATTDCSKCPSSPCSCLRGTIASVPLFSLPWITNPVTQHPPCKYL